MVVPSALEKDLRPKESEKGLQVVPFESSFTTEAFEKVYKKRALKGEWPVHEFVAVARDECEDTLRSNIYSQKIQDADFMLCDISILCCPILADKLGIQRIDISRAGFLDPGLSMTHNFPSSLAHIPQMSGRYFMSTKPSFFQRVQNLMNYGIVYVMHNFIIIEAFRKLRKKYTPDSKYEDIEGLVRSTGLLLLPIDFALSASRTLEPYMKVIGPILPEPAKPLPRNFQEIISTGPYKDVVVVSFGTVVVNIAGESFVDTLVSALNKIPATVIWKHKGKIPPNVGQNVKIVPWFPQNDLLGNPATKVFVTHGGLNSVYEAGFHGVAMVVVPFFGDEFQNAHDVVRAGIGEMIDAQLEMTTDNLIDKIQKVVTNNSYITNAKKIASKIIYPGRTISKAKGKPQKHLQSIRTPTEKAADWVEYGLHCDTGLHFRSEADKLSFIEVYMLDAILFYIICLIVLLMFICFIVRRLVMMCWSLMSTKRKTE